MDIIVRFNCLKKENTPVRKKGGWFDIPLPHDLYFKAGEIVKIVFDLRLEMPVGYEAIIQPRSSTLERTGLISSGFGVIEDCYCGKDDYIGYRFYATKDGLVAEGSCLVQMRFQKKMGDVKMIIMPDDYFNSNKNRGGFGSTDKNEQPKGTKEDFAKGAKTHLSSLYGKSCTEDGASETDDRTKFTYTNQSDWDPEPKTEYQQGFSTGFDEGRMDGYEEGFKDGYDKCVEDIKQKYEEMKVW